MKRSLLFVLFGTIFALQLHAKPEQCYCSIKCGPRDVRPDDTPAYATVTLPSGEEQEICFCQQRDIDNYLPNKCYKQKNQRFKSVCDKKSKKKRKVTATY